MGDRPDIRVDGQTFESPFHAFMHSCMSEKNLSGLSASEVQDELVQCSQAWQDVVTSRGPTDVDERDLAERFLEGREGSPTGES